MAVGSIFKQVAGRVWWLVRRGVALATRAAGRGCLAIGRDCRSVAHYYWTHRIGLVLLFAEYVPFFKEHGTRREIWADRDQPLRSIGCTDGVWRVRLPDCCVVCGEPTGEAWIDEDRQVPDLTWPLWLPLLGSAAGFVAAVYLGNFWPLPLGGLSGLGAGFHLRRQCRVELRFRRCADDAGHRVLPRVRLAKGRLVIDVGHRSVYRRFRELEEGVSAAGMQRADRDELVFERLVDVSLGDPPAWTPPSIRLVDEDQDSAEAAETDGTTTPGTPAATSPPKPIPLADDESDAASHNRHE